MRASNDDDWPAIWPLFRQIVERGDTYAFAPDIAEDEARAQWMSDEHVRRMTFVAVADDEVVGTAILRPNVDGLGDHVANAAFMVSPKTAGKGVGRRLAEFVLDQARQAGFTAMQFNFVVDSNVGAIRLWEKLGFAIVGTVPKAFRHAERGLTDVHIMHREL